jgi:hypothetical protein
MNNPATFIQLREADNAVISLQGFVADDVRGDNASSWGGLN